ncbi:hypothetical protein PM082_017854 [Marasmius tenuissimus]|nr:hypothetical protein PM082_017854 [Marasmius tenuissimus]
MATNNTHTGSGSQHNHNAMDQSINYGEGQVVSNAGRDVVINNYMGAVSDPLGTLWDAIAGVEASHKAERQVQRGTCLPGTRQEPLRMIHVWRTMKEQPCPICWLTGAAGVGKSAIAMTVAESCEKAGVLVSSFFFQADPKRNNPSSLMLSIAHGLALTMLPLRNSIKRIISMDPTIFQASLEVQFRELILAPTCSVDHAGSQLVQNIIVIDSLDECGDEDTQLRILSIIRSAFQQAPHFPLRFLICSRSESWIREAFSTTPLRQLTEVIVLDHSFMPDRDIRQYYVHHFREISGSPKYSQVQFPSPWPSHEELGALVWMSSGQFVYASTTVKFVRLAYSHPVTQFRTILDNTSAPANQIALPRA